MSIVASETTVAVQAWISAGTYPLPKMPDRKAPAVTGWQQYADAEPPAHIDASAWAGVCVPMGGRSRIEGIEFDADETADTDGVKQKVPGSVGAEFNRFVALMSARAPHLLGRILGGYLEQSPSGGIHLFIRRTSAVPGNEKWARYASGKTKVETRGTGGQFVVAPTPGYKVVSGSPDHIPTFSDDERELLKAVCEALSDKPAVAEAARPHVSPHDSNTGTGSAYVSPRGWDGVFEDTGWAEVPATHANISNGFDRAWARPGYDGSAESGAYSAVSSEAVLLVFSTTAQGDFEDVGYPGREHPNGGRTYTMAEVYAALHDGASLITADAGEYFGVTPEVEERIAADAQRAYEAHTAAEAAKQARAEAEVRVRAEGDDEAVRLPPGFWDQAPAFRDIELKARAAMVAPEAVLIAVLCRMAAMRPAGVMAETSLGAVSLNLFGGLLGSSSAGKSAAFGAARDMYEPPAWLKLNEFRDGAPPGSGEGIAQLYFGTVTKTSETGKQYTVTEQVRTNALMFADEAEVVSKLAQRNGSTLGSALRAAWSGGSVGSSNVRSNTYILEPPYALGFVACFQPAPFATLLEDANTGTPQRFIFADCQIKSDPRLPDIFPKPLGDPWTPFNWAAQPAEAGEAPRYKMFVMPKVIDDEIRANRAAQRWDGLKGKHDETRVRVAVLLAVLVGKPEVDDEAWKHAGLVVDYSDRVCARYVALAEAAQAETDAREGRRAGRRDVARSAQVNAAEHARTKALVSILNRLAKEPDAKDKTLRNAVRSDYRKTIPNDEWPVLLEQAREQAGVSGDVE